MSERAKVQGPQATMLFRVVAFFSRLQVGYLFHRQKDTQLLIILFALIAGTTALAIITMAAQLTKLPLLFPPLAPSAFILFYTPLSPSASPRNVFLSHTMGLGVGLLCLKVMAFFYTEQSLFDPAAMSWQRVVVIGLSTGLIGLLMIVLRCVHPPAAATALIAALGYFKNIFQVMALVAAVILLLVEAVVFVRLIGGLPYPIWKIDQRLTKAYRELADGIGSRGGFWQEISSNIYKKRR